MAVFNGVGHDTLAGTTGNDTFNVNSTTTVVTETTDGTNVVNSGVNFTLGAHLQTLNLTGTAAITGTGNSLGDFLATSTAIRTSLQKLIGNGTVASDTFYINHAGDIASENGTGTADHVISTASFTLGANIEKLTLTGSSAMTGTGNTLANTIVGGTGTNILSDGGAGGADTMTGNSSGGTDTFIVNNAGDHVTEAGHVGTTALVKSTVSFDLSTAAVGGGSTGVNQLTLSGAGALIGTGNTLASILTSSTTGQNTLIGASSTGHDTFYVNHASDSVTETGDNSSNTDLVISNSTISLAGTDINNLTLTGSSTITGTGNSLASILTSSTTGTNALIGGATTGSDTFYVNHSGDTVTESGSGTADLVVSNISFVLGANLEQLTLTGTTANLTGTGNALGNILTSSTGGINKLIGNGTAGSDTFYVNHANDTVTENGTGSADQIISNISFSLAAVGGTGRIEQLNLTGTGALTGTGTTLANIITGNANTTGSTVLNDGGAGGAGDTLIGNSTNGTDTFFVNNATDSVTEAGHAGTTALVNSTVTFDLRNVASHDINQLTLTGTGAALTATGNTNADILADTTTGAGSNVLIGHSASGGDTFIVNHTNDVVSEAGTATNDAVLSSVTWTLGTGMRSLTLTGAGNTLTAHGNATGDIITDATTGTGSNKLIGHSTAGADTFIVNHTNDTVSEAGTTSATDVVMSSVNFDIRGTTLHNLTLTGAAAITGHGNTLASVLTSSAGAINTLIGHDTAVGTSDTFYVNHANDVVSETSTSGTAELVVSKVNFTLGTNLENLTLDNTILTALTGTGNAAANTIIGNANTSGSTVLSDGGAGGADTITGNSVSGTDTFIVNNTGDHIVETNTATTALVQSSVSFNLLTGGTAGGATGVNSITLTGAGNHLTAHGGAAAGVISDATTGTTATGSNTLIGHSVSGGDTFIVTHTGDLISEAGASSANDAVISSVSFNLSTAGVSGADHLTLTGAAALTGTGNTIASVLTSSSTGTNTLIGNSASGGDTFNVNHSGDAVSENGTVSTGNLIVSTIAFDLRNVGTSTTGHVDQLTLTGTGHGLTAHGNGYGDILTDATATTGTGNGNNTLIGHDTTGGTNDTFVVNHTNDVVSEAGTATNDLVMSSVNWTLGAASHFTKLTLTGTTNNLTANGNGVANIITDATGGPGTNSHTLIGHDTTGGTHDTFVVSHTGDTVSEAGSVTGDLVISSVNWTLGAGTHFSDLTLTGTGALTGTGNTLANVITGNANTSGNTVLNDGGAGGAGDTMIGNSTAGNDTFYVNNATDSLTETNGGGVAVVNSTVSWTLGTNFDNLTLTGSGTGLTAAGNTSKNLITDNATGGHNTLIGNSSGGNDTFYVNTTGDFVTETNAGGAALISTTATVTMVGTGVNNAEITGTATGITVTANSGNDTITDNSTTGGNVFDDGGNGGHNSFIDSATAGDGTFYISSVNDTVTESDASSTHATVYSTINYTLGTNLNNLTLTGSSSLVGTGNALANVINGNTVGNVLNDGGATTAADTMIGHATSGSDTFVIYNTNDVISEAGSVLTSLALVQKTGNVSYSIANTGVHKLQFTGTGNDTGTGGDTGGDTIIGNSGSNVLSDGGNNTGTGSSLQGHSATGGDTFIVSNASDTISEAGNIGGGKTEIVSYLATGNFNSLTDHTGGGGGDYSGFYNLTLTGSADATGTGNNLANVITGNTGNDTLDGGVAGGAGDTLIGNSTDTVVGSGHGDTFVVHNTTDSVTEVNSTGGALIKSYVDFTLVPHVHQLTLLGTTGLSGTGTAGADTIIGSSGNNVLSDGGSDTNGDHLTGNSTVVGGGDTFIVSNAADVVLESGSTATALIESSATSFSLAGTNVHNMTLTGTTKISGTGSSGTDTITGNTAALGDFISDGGNDTGAGDLLIGNSSAGADTFFISNVADTITETNGPGASALIQTTVDYALGTGYNQLELKNTTGAITGTGNAASNLLTDSSTGGGNILTDGNLGGSDTMIDNAGNDTFIVNNTNDSITEAVVSTTSLVKSSVNWTLDTNLNNLTLTGSGNLSGTGNTSANVITGNTGNDVLDGGADTAADTLIGNSAAGHDTFIVRNTTDAVSENGATAGDVVQSYVSFSLADVSGTNAASVTKLTLVGTSGTGLTATGNSAANTITDNTGASGGHNVLVSGSAVTALVDNSTVGSDTFYVGNIADTITETNGSGTVIFQTGAGNVNYTIGANIGNVTLTGTGNDTITGNAAGNHVIHASNGTGINIISDGAAGGAGNDTMYAGNTSVAHDTFILNNGGDSVIGSNSGWSGDVIIYNVKNSTFNLGTDAINIHNLTLGGTGNGNDTITASSGDDFISATTRANVFKDGGTDDGSVVLTAGGNDTFVGGGGFDTFIIHNANDYISEAALGQYLVKSWTSFDLNNSANIRNLTLMGSANLSATANSSLSGSVLVGNTGSSILSDGGNTGGSGTMMIGNSNDTAIGHGDTFIVNNSLDTVSEAGTGRGTVMSSVSYTLGTGVQTLILTGSSGLTGTATTVGGAFIVGNTGADTLSDGGDTTVGTGDTMIGHSSTGDVFLVNNAADSVTELGSGSGSIVNTTVSFTLGSSNIHKATLVGTGTLLTVTGNSGADTITDSTTGGSSGHNRLVGGAGADSLVDNSTVGSDTFVVDNTGDVVVENAGSGLVITSTSFSLASGVSGTGVVNNLSLSGTGNITATGNGAANIIDASAINAGTANIVLNGGAGNDTLLGTAAAGSHVTFVVNDAGDVISSLGSSTDISISTSLNSTFNDLSTVALDSVGTLILSAGNQAGTADTVGHSKITGNGGHDTLTDSLSAAGGNEATLIGTGGDDVFNVNNAGDVVTETSATGTTTVNSTVSFTMGANMDVLNLTGAGLTGTANSGADLITSVGAGDTLVGGSGASTLIGDGAGDVFFVNSATTSVTESHVGSNALIWSTADFTLGANMHTLHLTGNANLSGSGNTTADILIGNSGDDILNDGGVGGAGDTLTGNSLNGNDTFVVYNATDMISEAVGGGASLVNAHITSGTLTIGSNIANIDLLGAATGVTLIGNGANNTITDDSSGGSNGGNILNGGVGADTMTDNSANGSDTFFVDNINDVITEANGSGTISTTVSYTMGTNIGTMTLTGTGTGLTLTGNSGGNTITDTAHGSNVIDGGTGNDTMTDNSSTGNGDTFVVNAVGDVVHEDHTATGALIQSSVDYSLAGTGSAGVRSLTLISGSGHTATGTGGATAVTLTDAVGGNTLDASADSGADTLVGGNDTMTGGAGADHFVFSADTAYNGIATINGFSHGSDKLDISNIISGANGGIGVSYRLDVSGGNTHLMVDYDHTNVSYGFVEVATIMGVTNLTNGDVL